MTVLSVNLNKVAVLRNSRGGTEPGLLAAAAAVIQAGCAGITVHPRPDLRHIRPDDVLALSELSRGRAELNIEGNPFAPASGSYPGLLTVSFGPKRLNFKGTLTNTVQRDQLTGELDGQASADVRGAKMLVSMRYRLSPAAGGTRVDLVSEAELTGMLAEFARTGGVVVTQALLDEFAKNFSAHMQAVRAGPHAGAPATQRQAPQALSAFGLLLKILKNAISRRPRPGG